ncbi:hypothetical protein MML48_2g00016492 [Holotrichia oblita]|uniref:Uncharacterized protein n=1 Tax=Holotrichia oblita TaxID=644536 RepID=A0ACB9TMQ0_HOLOL|nr:hypothetical protein MML48_2g00016492 [Holotrichia oblita]
MSDTEEYVNPSKTSVSWIYSLPKEKLIRILEGLDQSTTGTVDELRKRLSTFLKARPVQSSRPSSPPPPIMNPVDPTMSLCEKVRKWSLNYDGISDGTSFLERIRELQDCYDLEGKDLLKTLPILFRGNALLWYRNNKANWTTWDDFLSDFKIQYLPPRYDYQVEEEIRARHQRPNEAFKDYLTAILTLIRRGKPMDDASRLERVYNNMRPEYKLYARQSAVNTVKELAALAAEYERIQKEQEMFSSKMSTSTSRERVARRQDAGSSTASEGRTQQGGAGVQASREASQTSFGTGGQPKKLSNPERSATNFDESIPCTSTEEVVYVTPKKQSIKLDLEAEDSEIPLVDISNLPSPKRLKSAHGEATINLTKSLIRSEKQVHSLKRRLKIDFCFAMDSLEIDVDGLTADELLYELSYRGIKGMEGKSDDELRCILRPLLKLERVNKTFSYPAYVVDPVEELGTLDLKVVGLQLNVAALDTVDLPRAEQLKARVYHILNRINRIPTEGLTTDQSSKRSIMLAIALGQLDRLNTISSPESPLHDSTRNPEFPHFDFRPFLQSTQFPPPQRSMPVSKWQLKFSGDGKGMTVHSFLERANELRVARGLTTAQLFDSAIDLFKEEEIEHKRITPLRILNYTECIVPQLNNTQFQMHFRIQKQTLSKLVPIINQQIEKSNLGRPRNDIEKQLLAVLWLLATPDSSVGERFNMVKASLSNSFTLIINALNNIAPNIISWPTFDKIPDVIQGFHRISGVNNVVGAIDGTLIPIKAPVVDPEVYITRKSNYAMTLQAVCISNLKFTNCFMGYPGSVSDTRIFRNSTLYKKCMENPRTLFPNEHLFIIGDKAYPIFEWCIPPYIDRGTLTHDQRNFNKKISQTRQVIERAFALLFDRLRRLKYLDMTNTNFIPNLVIACCVLHNLCLDQNDTWLNEYIADGLRDIAEHEEHVAHDDGSLDNICRRGTAERQYLCNILSANV